MKATGIVRRIDDLGRVVIPKEIRRTMRIREGDPLEIYTDTDGQVIFKKYSPMGELSEFAAQICDALHKTTGGIAAVCDRDAVIAVAVAAPILSEGDVLGCVLFVAAHGDGPAGETERKLAQAVSGFLGKQMES
jgi:AbrB family transcriptional regulator (stage V sporulation protein T)